MSDNKLFQDLFEDEEEVVEEEIKKKEEEKQPETEEEKAKREADEKAKKDAEERQKNKDAEEARKRREAEGKKGEKVNELGKQLVDFKAKHPNVDLKELDEDKNFKNFIDGKLLGKKDFTTLYGEYIDLKSEMSGKSKEEVISNYQAKAQASVGVVGTSSSNQQSTEYYTEEELGKLAMKMKTMHPREIAKIEDKFKKSIKYYDSKK